MNIFHYEDYRHYLKDMIVQKPQQGRGEISRIARHLNVHSTLISLILSGKRDLSQEQAFDLCQYLELSELETEFFFQLLQLQRAGSERLRTYMKKKIVLAQQENSKLASRVKDAKILKDPDKATFYSSWLYSAIRMYCSTQKQGRSLDEITDRFQVSRTQALEILQFLLKTLLLEEDPSKPGFYKMGPQKTYVPFGSPFLVRHHLNWRIQSLQKADHMDANEMMVTAPISISKKDFARVRDLMTELLEKTSKIVKDSEAEEIACMNLDLFWID